MVSIIIPVFNSEKFIEETLQSISNQNYSDWECILVDDGSTDNSWEIMQRFVVNDTRFKSYKRPDNLPKGANSCRNFGFEQSKGECINWFDSDDVMLENFLSVKMDVMNNALKMVIASGSFADESLKQQKAIPLVLKSTLYLDYIGWKLKVLTPSILFKREFLVDKELFSHKIKKGQEMEFFSRIFFDVSPDDYVIVDKSTYLYRSHENSSTAQNQIYKKEFKESEAYTLFENLKRVQQLQNKPMIASRYRLLVNLLFKALKNKHPENVAYILSGFRQYLYPNNKMVIFLLERVVASQKLVKTTFLPWDKIFKKMPIH
ncbi:glycosyltransferase family 2 protein [Flavobacterium sp.]|uniref:glycosyltransferase family 2 protein n=1 Tax=Flavobacterium sp. TaxID=239 RepID=UPI0028BDD53C|nr:glycosyltransferase family 2 protein [Flavobacterium sp.]